MVRVTPAQVLLFEDDVLMLMSDSQAGYVAPRAAVDGADASGLSEIY